MVLKCKFHRGKNIDCTGNCDLYVKSAKFKEEHGEDSCIVNVLLERVEDLEDKLERNNSILERIEFMLRNHVHASEYKRENMDMLRIYNSNSNIVNKSLELPLFLDKD